MEYLNPNSLRQLPRHELLALYQRIAALLATLREGSRERATALINLANIRWALRQHELRPR